MIRCSECSRCKQLNLDYGRKKFYFCAEDVYSRPSPFHNVKKFWEEKPKGHPHWCPKYKEAKK